jgi:hypothetical protein
MLGDQAVPYREYGIAAVMPLAIFGHRRHATTGPADALHEDVLPSISLSIDFSFFTAHEAMGTMTA